MKTSNFVGWDIGGAHLKVASINGLGKVELVEQVATPLWQGVDSLKEAIPAVIGKLPIGTQSHAVTMTAELVDIFKDRESGIKSLITLCEESLGDDISFYAAQAGVLRFDNARNNLHEIASANWHASATYVASLIESGLFIDVGSTTTDIIPFSNNRINNRGLDDQNRLRFDELVYTGVVRTSLMSLAEKVPFAGEWQNLATEHFANTADVYRILGYLDEGDDMMETADGNAKDIVSSVRRLARMLGTDSSKFNHHNYWVKLAQYFAEAQLQLLTKAALRVLTISDDKEPTIVAAGAGRFLAKKIAQRLSLPYIEFSDLCNSDIALLPKCNTCAPAVALAQLNRLSTVG
jgi:(4-(4-[2-(gamma-L-glutamylamino)ethyl]phenoxymethyl)furan-2-yl)methanamine synthase